MGSGYVSRLPSDVLLDTGVLYHGGTIIGPSRGGLSFDPGSEMTNIPYDGKKSNKAGLDRKTFVDPVISGRLLLFAAADIARYEHDIASTTPGGNITARKTPKAAGVLFDTGDYIHDLRLVFERRSSGFVQVRFVYALCTRWRMTGQDRGEVEIDCEFHARNAAGDAEGVVPFVIEELSAIS